MKKIRLFGAVLAALSLASCTPATPSSSSSTTPDSSTPNSSVVSSDTPSSSTSDSSSSSADYNFDFPADVTIDDKEKVNRVSMSGVFLDTAVGSHLVVGKTYTFTMTPSAQYDPQGTVLKFEYDESILEISHVSGETYTIKAKKAGGSIVTAKDEGDFIFFKDAVNARNKATLEEATAYLSLPDYWKAQYSVTGSEDYIVYFNSDLTGVLQALVSGTRYNPIYLTLTYSTESSTSDYDEYLFTVVAKLEDGTAAPVNVTEVNISVTLDIVHLLDNNGLINFFKPVFEKD